SPPPPASGNAMDRHKAGAAWMWAGLVSSDDAVFQKGASLFVFPLEGAPVPAELRIPVEQAQQAAGAWRATAYGSLLATCASCHASVVTERPPDVLAAEMHERFALLGRAREAVREGRRRDWRDAAGELGALEGPLELTEGAWAPWMDQLRRLAGRLELADDREQAAVALGRVAQHCGACHTAIGEGPHAPREDELDDHEGPEELLWLGLLTGDDALWIRGAEASGMPGIGKAAPLERPALYGQVLVR
ncbi:MAG: hypothetical protein KC656_17065, partial [Myxococcales bacterium]|nr:hypothetical protein [Myxococcales bacterium]